MTKRPMRATSCYFTPDERRVIQEIAEREERPQTRIVQFAVRAYANLYRVDPAKARELAQQPNGATRW
jgi:predicted transcriptional regulator